MDASGSRVATRALQRVDLLLDLGVVSLRDQRRQSRQLRMKGQRLHSAGHLVEDLGVTDYLDCAIDVYRLICV